MALLKCAFPDPGYTIWNRDRVQVMYLQPIITQYFIGNKSEIWSLSLIVHSKG